MLVKKKDRVEHKNSDKCIAYEYPFDQKNINTSYIKIDGRYPESGYVINKVVDEIVFIVSGSGKVVIDGKEFELSEQDIVYIPPKKKYFFDGKFSMVVSCSPAWYPEQHIMVEE